MSLANLMALVQRDVKRMLAFSSISHAGFVLCAIVIGSTQANAALFTYWILYAVANLGAFAFIWCVRQRRACSLNLKFKTQSPALNLNANGESFISNAKPTFSQNREPSFAGELNLGASGQNLACGERSFKASEQNSKAGEQNFKASELGAEATPFGTETCGPSAKICEQSSNCAARFEHPFEKFDGLIRTHPLFALCAAIFMLSLAGIPPFSVFWGKMYLLSAAVNSGYFALAVIMAVNSALALYYYLRLIVRMFLHEPRKDVELDGSLSAVSVQIKFAVVLASVACVLAPFLVKFLTGAVNNFVFLSGY